MTHEREVIGACTLYRGDALEVLPTLRAVDIVIADPPYGIALDTHFPNSNIKSTKVCRASKGYPAMVGDHDRLNAVQVFQLLAPVTEQFWWGANYYTNALPHGGSWLVWDKRDGLPPMSYSLAEFELCWSKVRRHQKILRHRWFGLCGTETQDMRERVHPTQKPLGLFADLLALAPQATTCLDPFMGSGSCGVACVRRGVAFTGIEIEPRYFDIACRRIEAAYGQLELFAPLPPAPPPRQEVLL